MSKRFFGIHQERYWIREIWGNNAGEGRCHAHVCHWHVSKHDRWDRICKSHCLFNHQHQTRLSHRLYSLSFQWSRYVVDNTMPRHQYQNHPVISVVFMRVPFVVALQIKMINASYCIASCLTILVQLSLREFLKRNISVIDDDFLCSLLLYGIAELCNLKNRMIIESTVKYIKSSNRLCMRFSCQWHFLEMKPLCFVL